MLFEALYAEQLGADRRLRPYRRNPQTQEMAKACNVQAVAPRINWSNRCNLVVSGPDGQPPRASDLSIDWRISIAKSGTPPDAKAYLQEPTRSADVNRQGPWSRFARRSRLFP